MKSWIRNYQIVIGLVIGIVIGYVGSGNAVVKEPPKPTHIISHMNDMTYRQYLAAQLARGICEGMSGVYAKYPEPSEMANRVVNITDAIIKRVGP